MSGLTAYSGLTTKIKAMGKYLLKEEDFQEILELSGIPEAVNYLRRIPSYNLVFQSLDENNLHREAIEPLLRQSIYHDYAKIYKFAGQKQREFLKLYFMRYEVYFLKQCLTNIFDHRDTTLDLSLFTDFFEHHSKIDFNALSSSSSLEEFRDKLKGTDYYEPLCSLESISSPTLFDYEMTLDLYVFGKQWKTVSKMTDKGHREILTRVLGSKFDMLNLQWIWRSKKYYHMETSAIYALVIPVYHHISQKKLQDMIEADSLEILDGLIRESYYGKRFQEFDSSSMEILYSSIMKKLLQKEKRNKPYSLASIYSYLYQKDHETDRLTIALECLRYRIPPEEAMQHINCR